ncbi:MAG: hypothetical protein ACHP7N_00305 [Caulobacterales bacterium]
MRDERQDLELGQPSVYAAQEAERCAWVRGIEAEAAAVEKAVRESPEAKAHPDILSTALFFSWDLDMFRQAIANRGKPLLIVA